jgi:hypothetical protein
MLIYWKTEVVRKRPIIHRQRTNNKWWERWKRRLKMEVVKQF